MITNNFTVLAKKRIVVEINNGNQEKEFRHLCLTLGETLVKKDDTAYHNDGTKKKAIYPIYYGFVQVGQRRTTWWSLEIEQILEQNYSLVSFNGFKKMINKMVGEKK